VKVSLYERLILAFLSGYIEGWAVLMVASPASLAVLVFSEVIWW